MARDKREILAEVLAGSLSMEKAKAELLEAIKDKNPVVVAMLDSVTGLYTVGSGTMERTTMTEDEFKSLTKFNHTLVAKILRDPNMPPIATCEKDVVL